MATKRLPTPTNLASKKAEALTKQITRIRDGEETSLFTMEELHLMLLDLHAELETE